ncbi:MAG: DUF308 domain-containing protein [Candidatus Saccharibacteria bacterium]|nr:DUF308 domain-containing protein [Candidatus Saccharibacteria bacterium]
MAKINRKFIDKHWLLFVLRGALAGVFGCLILFTGTVGIENLIALVSVFLLTMGIIDAVGALYSSTRKHGWINSIIDALIDVVAAVALLFFAKDSLVSGLVIISVYTILSGLVDIFHGFLSTVDPTDRFIRVLAGVFGCVMGLVILNAGNFEILTFLRFFGAYMLIVGVTSMIYGVHNREQGIEDKVARSQARKKTSKKRK